ncbi:hypothetical protein M885DRAFT_528702 [Pelagophyceae sp. CCMP2097]|nr:hypothetical protein M885DRAFT_528702 [Pelagophyceae sp. CCMP2097]
MAEGAGEAEADTKRKREGALAEAPSGEAPKQRSRVEEESSPDEEAAVMQEAMTPTAVHGESAEMNGGSAASSAAAEAFLAGQAAPQQADAGEAADADAAVTPDSAAAAAQAAAQATWGVAGGYAQPGDAPGAMPDGMQPDGMGGMQPGGAHYPTFERTEKVECPQSLVGRLIGKQGETIKDLQRRSGARIQIDQNYPEGQPRIVTIEGSSACVDVGCELVRSLIGNSPAVGNGAPGQMTTMECPKQLVGRVIGKGGETINELQRRSGARIQIEQRVAEGAPCIIEIQGDDASVAEAVRLTQEVMSGRRLESTAPALPHYGAAAQGYGYGGDAYAQQAMALYGPTGDAYAQPQPAFGYGGAAPAEAYAQYGGAYAQQVAAYGAQYAQYAQQQAQYAAQQAAYGGAAYAAGSPAAANPGAANGWTSHADAQGRTYWHNAGTQESTWETPPGH